MTILVLTSPFSLKEAMVSPYWKRYEKAMHAEFESLIDNEI